MRYVLATLVCATLCTASVAGERLPTFPKQTDYGDARRSLLALGWAPVTMPDADACDDDDRCRGRPEMEACAGTGLGNCSFTWKRNGTLIAVGTIGETRPTVMGVQCRAGCR